MPEYSAPVVSIVLEQARRGLSLINRRPKRPSGFTERALEHLEWIARAIEAPGVDRLVFFALGNTETISQATLKNIRSLLESAGPSSGNDPGRR